MKIYGQEIYQNRSNFEPSQEEDLFDLDIQIIQTKPPIDLHEQTATTGCTVTCQSCGCHSLNCPTVLCR